MSFESRFFILKTSEKDIIHFLYCIFTLKTDEKYWYLYFISYYTINMYEELQQQSSVYLALEESENVMTWCDDCGNYAIQKAVFQALTLQGISPQDTIVAYDV